MDKEGSLADSQEEIFDEEETDLPSQLNDEFFSQISQNTHQIIKHLQGSGEATYATQTQQIYLACRKLRQDYNRAVKEIEDTRTELENSERRLTKSVTLSKVDHVIIGNLKKETVNAWRQTDAAQLREQLAHQQLYLLREKLDKLTVEADKTGTKKGAGDELDSSLVAHKESILKERDRLSAEVEELKRRLQIQRLYTDEIESKRAETEEKNKELYKMLDDVSGQAYKGKRTIDTMNDRLAVLMAENAALTEEVKEIKRQSESLVTNNVQQNLQILALKANLERTTTHCNTINNKLSKYQVDVEHVNEMKEKLQFELNLRNGLLKLKDDEITKYKLDLSKMEKTRDSLLRKLLAVQQSNSSIEAELSKVKADANAKTKQENINSKAVENLEKKIKICVRERNTIQNEIPRISRRIAEVEESLLLARTEIRSMKEEIKQKDIIQKKQKSLISRMELERDRDAEAAQILEDKIDTLNEEIHLKEEYIAELKEGASELNSNLTKMQTLFETARMERNSFENSLQTCLEEKDDFKSKLAIANRKIEQNQEAFNNKENELLRQQKNLEKLEKEFQKARMDFRNLEIILQNTRSELKEKRDENDRLYKTLSDDEIRLDKIRKQYDIANYEKDTIGTQLIRRNNEIALLKENLQVLQQALDRGERQYAERIEDIRLLKIEIRNLHSQRNILTRGLANTADMRQEVLQLHRVLNQERVKAKALEEEMITPMNVHRWRTLGGKDPEKLTLITKIQSMQRRILSQTVQATEREEAIQESHKLYNTLKDFMLKLPSYKVKERLVETQHALQVRDRKLKALSAELNAKAIDEKSKDFAVDELRCNLEVAKKELIQEKKKKQKLISECEIVKRLHSYSAPSSFVKTMGAGFKMTQSS